MREQGVMHRVMLALSRAGCRVHRNNTGVADYNGVKVRYGVGGTGGADLIGWMPVVVTPEMVGRKLAVFTAIETKAPRGRLTDDQARFLAAVQDAGGFAGVARSDAEALAIVSSGNSAG